MAWAPRNHQPVLYIRSAWNAQGHLLQGERVHSMAWGPMQPHTCADNQLYMARQGHMLQGQRVHRVAWDGMSLCHSVHAMYTSSARLVRATRLGLGHSAKVLFFSCLSLAVRLQLSNVRSHYCAGSWWNLGPTLTWGVCARTLLLAVQVWRLGARLELHVQALQGQALTHSAVPLLTVRHQ